MDILRVVRENQFVQYGLGLAVLAIAFWLLSTFTDVPEKMLAPENLKTVLILVLLGIVAYIWLSGQKMAEIPDAMLVFARLCHTQSFLSKGYHFEGVPKEVMWWESGPNRYYFHLKEPKSNKSIYALAFYYPDGRAVCTDLLDREWTPAEKKKRLGLEWSVEEIKQIEEMKEKMKSLPEE